MNPGGFPCFDVVLVGPDDIPADEGLEASFCICHLACGLGASTGSAVDFWTFSQPSSYDRSFRDGMAVWKHAKI